MLSRKFWTEGIGSFLIAIGVALLIRWALFEAYVIPSGSMLPTLLVHDHIFVNKMVYGLRIPFTEQWLFETGEPERGDVVVFKYPEDKNQFYIKRVVGLPGDRIFYENGNLYVNDQLVEKVIPSNLKGDMRWVRNEDFPGESLAGGKTNFVHWQEILGERTYSILLRGPERAEGAFGPYTVPQRHFFVLGDNRDKSEDSRAWDPQATRARGHVVFVRNGASGSVRVPKGAILRAQPGSTWGQKFITQEEVILEGDSVSVSVEAAEPGALGNWPAGSATLLDPEIVGVRVTQPLGFSGGEDRRFVPREYLVGRANRVWLSCEKTLPVLTFLCHPLYIRWGRLFHKIQ